MSATTPQVSVCIPTWNGARFLQETLQSLRDQEEAVLEVVISDDASSDATLDIARSASLPNLRVEAHTTRLEIPGNWERAVAAARGEFVLLLLQDDVLLPGSVAALQAALLGEPGAVLAFGRRDIRREDGHGPAASLLRGTYPALQEAFYASIQGPLSGLTLVRNGLSEGRDLCVNVIGEPSFVLVRRRALRAAGGFDPRLRQLVDWELWLRLAAQGPVCFVDHVLGSFRLHEGGASARQARSPRTAWEHVRVLDTVLACFGAALRPAEQRAVRSARNRYRRHVVGEAFRWLLRSGAPA